MGFEGVPPALCKTILFLNNFKTILFYEISMDWEFGGYGFDRYYIFGLELWALHGPPYPLGSWALYIINYIGMVFHLGDLFSDLLDFSFGFGIFWGMVIVN